MITERQTKSLIKAIEKFNADLAAYTQASGDSDLPYIDSTVIGYSHVKPYTYQVYKTRVSVADGDDYIYIVKDETDLDEVMEALKYDRRRLNKAWRVFKSENPDWEMEQDKEDEE